MNTFFRLLSACLALTLLCGAPAGATPINLRITWSGEAFQNSATGIGLLRLDDSLLAEDGVITGDNPLFGSLVVKIAGAGVGDGTFTMRDFFYIDFLEAQNLDLSRELIGQPLGNGCLYGTSRGACGDGNGGDFNVFSNIPVPFGTWYFEIMVANGDRLLVTSILPVASVPEPGTLALLALAALGLTAVFLLSKASSGTVSAVPSR
ncbi:PEP-CTERM sorting domain-containing protein [Massilia sp. CF038]|uniref:PEP-CTERM sorting domain-containing protein n=1 Tax=Massilia sp. CF038 TaxID=1881045 RepID=UPI0009184AA0|nr:PEP-CTERM sorting domain-containing protein [Massilia sp. CF038]SHG98936.1 PEP-CTERM protein-sorting domain-containing protein [Massilia sp. CF038]